MNADELCTDRKNLRKLSTGRVKRSIHGRRASSTQQKQQPASKNDEIVPREETADVEQGIHPSNSQRACGAQGNMRRQILSMTQKRREENRQSAVTGFGDAIEGQSLKIEHG